MKNRQSDVPTIGRRAAAAVACTEMIEWVRLGSDREIARALVRGALLSLTGCLLMAYTWRSALDDTSVRFLAGVIGLVVTASGPGSVVHALRRTMSNERYVGVRRDALVVGTGGTETTYPWETVGDLRAEGSALIIERNEGDVRVDLSEAREQAPEIARRLAHARRRILMELT